MKVDLGQDHTNNSLHDRVVQAIGRRIVHGSLRPGAIVDSDGELASEFGASRTAMREAVRVLTAKGLVESRPRLGTRVRSPDHWNYLDADVLAWQHLTGSAQWKRDLIEMRRLIEPQAAALAASRADPQTVAQLRQYLLRMEENTRTRSVEDAIRADIAFHSGILAATGNRMIASLRYTISASLRAGLTDTRHDLLQLSMPAHFDVLHAIENHDSAGARAAMEALIDHAAHDLLSD